MTSQHSHAAFHGGTVAPYDRSTSRWFRDQSKSSATGGGGFSSASGTSVSAGSSPLEEEHAIERTPAGWRLRQYAIDLIPPPCRRLRESRVGHRTDEVRGCGPIAVTEHLAVRAAVIGLPDPRWGEAVTTVVMRKPGTEPVTEAVTEAVIEPVSEPDLIAFCRARLVGFETPKRVIFVENYPETVGGKVLKHVLRAELGDRR